jgi:AcrR family transcriptional regulator
MARPRTFDADDLVTAGLAVVARGGWDAISVRSVAAELGVTPMALYRLAPDADRLRRAVADAAARPLVPAGVEALLARAAARGTTGPGAVARVNAVFAYVLARAQLHDGLAAAPGRRLTPVAADPGRYPHLAAVAGELAVARTERHFRYGLAALLAGLPP